MQRIQQSPLAVYQAHLEKGDLAYQWSEGFRLMSRVEGIAPEAVKIGLRVRFRVHRPGGDEPPYPVFVPWVDSPRTSVMYRK